jgi:hypothetical protein
LAFAHPFDARSRPKLASETTARKNSDGRGFAGGVATTGGGETSVADADSEGDELGAMAESFGSLSTAFSVSDARAPSFAPGSVSFDGLVSAEGEVDSDAAVSASEEGEAGSVMRERGIYAKAPVTAKPTSPR